MRFMEKVPVRVASMVQNSYEFFFIEIKPLFSVILTRLGSNGSTLPHSHPFNAVTLMLKGQIVERRGGEIIDGFRAGQWKATDKGMHSISTDGSGAWLLTFRGPWSSTWQEEQPDGTIKTLTHGRKEI